MNIIRHINFHRVFSWSLTRGIPIVVSFAVDLAERLIICDAEVKAEAGADFLKTGSLPF